MSVQSTDPDGDPSPPDDSVAQLALSTANSALALAQSVQASQKQVRASSPQAIPTGDSTVSFGWSPSMPNTNFNIAISLYAGAVGHPSAYYGFRVLESSITVDGFSVLLDNIPANTKLAFYAVER